MKNLNFMKSPVHKLKVILRCAETVVECIDTFYKKHNSKSNNLVESDDVMNIFVYATV